MVESYYERKRRLQEQEEIENEKRATKKDSMKENKKHPYKKMKRFLLSIFSFVLGCGALYLVYFVTPSENIVMMKDVFFGYGNHILISVFMVGNIINSIGIYLQEKRKERL
jgi:hypothetical protein